MSGGVLSQSRVGSEVKSVLTGRGFGKEVMFYAPPLTSKLVNLEVQIQLSDTFDWSNNISNYFHWPPT